MLFLEQQTICMIQNSSEWKLSDDDIAEAVYSTLATANWCREQGLSIDSLAFQLSSNQTAILHSLNRVDEDLRMQQAVFLSLQITGGHVGLVLLVIISLLVPTIHRDLVFFNFCITWIISSIVFTLGLYQDISKHNAAFPLSPKWDIFPPSNLYHRISLTPCVTQAALIDGVQPMTAFSTLALISKLWFDLRTSIYGTGIKLDKIGWILILPYIVLVTMFIVSLFNISHAIPGNFYCSTTDTSSIVTWIVPLSTAFFLVLTLPCDVLLFKMMYSHWSTFRLHSASSVISRSILIRVVIFGVYRMVLAFAYIWPVVSQQRTLGTNSIEIPMLMDMFQAALPLVAFLVLGTTKNSQVRSREVNSMLSKRYQTKTSNGMGLENKKRTIVDKGCAYKVRSRLRACYKE
ncbi:hypothetical protein K439DRAFT_1659305 [Ramaria rubella]|nr:hypothetical protein K439DRAFT_1659305 [Ramaria rubella]